MDCIALRHTHATPQGVTRTTGVLNPGPFSHRPFLGPERTPFADHHWALSMAGPDTLHCEHHTRLLDRRLVPAEVVTQADLHRV